MCSTFGYFRNAIGHESGDDERSAGPKVGCFHLCPFQLYWPVDDHRAALHFNDGIHPPQLVNMLQAGGVDRIRHNTRIVRFR